jgi:putative thioredoxin
VSQVHDVDTAGFNQQVIERSHDLPVVVDFWAEWCEPCKTLGPTLERLADEAGGGFELAKVDVDQNQALAGQMGVQGIPTVVAFKNGQPVSRFTGALPEAQVKEWLSTFLPNPIDDFVTAADDLVNHGRAEEAATMYRKVLEDDATHQSAAVGLASILLADGDADAALEVLEPLPAGAEVDRLRAAARLGRAQDVSVDDLEAKTTADPDNDTHRIDLARARIATQDHELALEHLLEVVAHKGEALDDARTTMLDLFEILGPDHPLTNEYRRRLANTLF